jgi:hypothetical protein
MRATVRFLLARISRATSRGRNRGERKESQRTQRCAPPTAPDDGEPNRPPDELDSPDGGATLGSQLDDGGNPEEGEHGDDVDAARREGW